MTSPELFDTAVIDSNFFIALVETGIEKTILPILKDKLPITNVMPYELPRSDIPRRFRDLRQILPKYIKGIKVNRRSSFWVWTSELAQRLHFIRAGDDPADIDVVVLARLLEKQKGKKVAVVSNDEGVINTIREVIEFQNIITMSAGSFLFTLSALVDDEKLSPVLTDAGDKLFNQYLSYRRKSRKFINIKSLVAELKDTSIYIRNATKTSIASSQNKAKAEAVKLTTPQVDHFSEVITIVNDLMNYRNTYNLMGGEEYLYSLTPKISQLLGSARNSDDYRMMIAMFIGEVYSFRTWAMDIRLKTGGIFEAAIHAENLLMIMNFMKVNKEIIEDILALQSLLFLLNGKNQQALSISKQIPQEDDMSSAQLMAMICTLIGQKSTADTGLAENLLKKYTLDNEIVDLEGVISSLLKFSNTLYLFDNHNHDLAIDILDFLIRIVGKKTDLMKEVAYRLFLVTRLNPALLSIECKELLTSILEKFQLVDDTNKKIPSSWRKIKTLQGTEGETSPFLGNVTILHQQRPFNKLNEFHVIGYEENTRSTWRYIFPVDYAPSLNEALGFKLKGGVIMKLLNKTQTDPVIRGTLVIENPAFQVDMQVHLD